MKPILLGTAASEAIPAVFCECPVCTHVRQYKGKDVRTRSSFLIDDYSIIDLSPDVYHQTLNCSISLNRLKNIFLTHFHEDHFNVMEMGARMCAIPKLEDMVTIICSSPAAEQLSLMFDRLKDHNREEPFNYFQRYQFATVEPFKTYRFSNLTVTPVLSSHHSYGIGEMGLNYLIKPDHAPSFLYAVDTGWYSQETWNFLENRRVDYIIMECTYGNYPMPEKASEHLNFDNLIMMLEKLHDLDVITYETKIFLTHISHLNTVLYDNMGQYLKKFPFNIVPGFDGLEIDV